MYDLSDTIVAVSSPTADKRVIVRITGPDTFSTCNARIAPPISDRGVTPLLHFGTVAIDDGLETDAKVYLFKAPHSYTGEDVAEIHLYTNHAVTEVLVGNLLSQQARIRMAGPGEFTARAYLNGKLDLAQAEAVNEIIISSNEYQLAAAERLLQGRLGQTAAGLRNDLVECLSLVEAGLDFSGEDIEFISRPEAVKRLAAIKEQLGQLLEGSISSEALVDLPSVGIAGAPNAGKSSLLNRLLGKDRSIVSSEHKTTRDVLTGVWTLPHCECVLFDCAGLLTSVDNIIDELSQEAAVEALRNSEVVIFCVDISKGDWDEDAAIRQLIEPKAVVPVATKCDLVADEMRNGCVAELSEFFGGTFIPTSSRKGDGMEMLGNTIDNRLVRGSNIAREVSVTLTARHRKAVVDAIENVGGATDEVKIGNDEVAAMMLRAAHQAVCDLESTAGGSLPVDEQILEQIFSRFCIGK